MRNGWWEESASAHVPRSKTGVASGDFKRWQRMDDLK